jgi:hypothetical protein
VTLFSTIGFAHSPKGQQYETRVMEARETGKRRVKAKAA